jgi:hypothetical protein
MIEEAPPPLCKDRVQMIRPDLLWCSQGMGMVV